MLTYEKIRRRQTRSEKSIRICSLSSVLKRSFAPNSTIHNYYTADFVTLRVCSLPNVLKRSRVCLLLSVVKKRIAPNCTYTMTRHLVFEIFRVFVDLESVWKCVEIVLTCWVFGIFRVSATQSTARNVEALATWRDRGCVLTVTHTATPRTLQHAATHCNALQHGR